MFIIARSQILLAAPTQFNDWYTPQNLQENVTNNVMSIKTGYRFNSWKLADRTAGSGDMEFICNKESSCLYQGELYALENNECRLICDEYSDETGRRYWNEHTKKCEHDCETGYMNW